MRVQTEEWRRFIPGVRMYKGKKTLFYNGEKLMDEYEGHPLIYDREEMKSWEVIIVLPGVEMIPEYTFAGCKHTTIGIKAIMYTALIEASPFEIDGWGEYDNNDEANSWIRNINQNEEFALHRECASIEPSEDNIYQIIKRQGLSSIHVKNQIGFTALEYLEKNPFVDSEITEQNLINRYVLDLMGEIIT